MFNHKKIIPYVWPAFLVLIEWGLQISGYTNKQFANCLFALAALTFLYALWNSLLNKSNFSIITNSQNVKSFISIKEAQLRKIQATKKFDAKRMSRWKDQLIEGLKTAYHGDIQNRDILASLTLIESRIDLFQLYSNSMSEKDKKGNVEDCLGQLKLMKTFVLPYELSDKFQPDDLKTYEKLA